MMMKMMKMMMMMMMMRWMNVQRPNQDSLNPCQEERQNARYKSLQTTTSIIPRNSALCTLSD